MGKQRLVKLSLEEVQSKFVQRLPKTQTPRIFDSLTTSPLKSLDEAKDLIPRNSLEEYSNVLYYRTRNQTLKASDFNLLWKNNSNSFDINHKDRRINLIRSREAGNLIPRGGYYLVFKSPKLASAYLIDNLGSQIDGVNIYLQMINTENHLKYMTSKFIDEPIEKTPDNLISIGPSFNRNKSVIVKGFPTFITQKTIEHMLWNYSLDFSVKPVTCLNLDKKSKVGMWLLTFTDEENASLFVKDYHGKHFNDEKRLFKVFATIFD